MAIVILTTAAAFIYVLCFWDDPAIRRFDEAKRKERAIPPEPEP